VLVKRGYVGMVEYISEGQETGVIVPVPENARKTN
jgi:hypothetical protein